MRNAKRQMSFYFGITPDVVCSRQPLLLWNSRVRTASSTAAAALLAILGWTVKSATGPVVLTLLPNRRDHPLLGDFLQPLHGVHS